LALSQLSYRESSGNVITTRCPLTHGSGEDATVSEDTFTDTPLQTIRITTQTPRVELASHLDQTVFPQP